MKVPEKAVRQSVSLTHAVGTDRERIDAEKRRQHQFFALAERFRNEQDPEAANRLGDELGRMVFGG
jgi:hypothetical protein